MHRRRKKSRRTAKIKQSLNFKSFKEMFSFQLNFSRGAWGGNVCVQQNISYVANNQDDAFSRVKCYIYPRSS